MVSIRSYVEGVLGLPTHLPWRELDVETEYVRAVLDRVAESHCVDRSRIFGVGHGAGGDFLERVHCALPFAALATTSNRGTRANYACTDGRSVPLIHFEGRANQATPIEGTDRNCHGHRQIPLSEYEELWRGFSGCSDRAKEYSSADDYQCTTWAGCEFSFVSCVHDYGHDWPLARPDVFSGNCLART